MAKDKPAGAEPMTMEDLAALAGVSKITVSRALRDSPLVRESVRERIKELSAAHGYRINAAARSLRTRRAHTITAAIEMDPTTERPLSEPMVLIVIGALLQAFATRGYRLVLTTRSEALSSNVLDTEGVMLMGLGPNDEAIEQMRRFNLPLAVWGSSRPAFDNVVFLGSDNVGGGRLLGEHLAALGRKRILFLGDTIHTEVADRLAGLTTAVSGRDIQVRQVPCEFNRDAARAVVESELTELTGAPRFDAIVGCSDPIALGAIDALAAAGLNVPADVAVTGYDDATREPHLTSVRQDWNLAGTIMADMMFDLLAGRPVSSRMLPVELIVRASTES
jgi:DNA-binding LacI/PurR family transcriptional regulator